MILAIIILVASVIIFFASYIYAETNECTIWCGIGLAVSIILFALGTGLGTVAAEQIRSEENSNYEETVGYTYCPYCGKEIK